ncbi:hypothetical protein M9Y10_036122 [Tritrichomonas musculus]|uniref:E3 ubiquitin-protein ligase n=1 Tax=Tritrichomonas musculus TaxID=1915356 RepID=A0ABR2GVA2_9EUKA
MSIYCFICGNTPSSCICLQCFLKGDHKGHEYTISADSIGNCDCGDLSMWKRSGFCSVHQNVENEAHPESYLTPELRAILTDVIFKAAFMSLQTLNTDKEAKYEAVLQFGDGFRRLVTVAFTEKVGVNTIFSSIFDGSAKFNQQLEQLC